MKKWFSMRWNAKGVVKMRTWFKDRWHEMLIVSALALLAVAMRLVPADFQYLAWYGLVALTALYVLATMRIAVVNQQTIKEMKQARLDIVKPAFSLQPEGFTFGGGFSALCLMNSGGVAKDVKVDIEVTNPDSKSALFIPTINREHVVYLEIDGSVQDKGGLIKVQVNFKDDYGQNLSESLSINFSELKKEGRKIRGQYSELGVISHTLEEIKSEISNIKRGYWERG